MSLIVTDSSVVSVCWSHDSETNCVEAYRGYLFYCHEAGSLHTRGIEGFYSFARITDAVWLLHEGLQAQVCFFVYRVCSEHIVRSSTGFRSWERCRPIVLRPDRSELPGRYYSEHGFGQFSGSCSRPKQSTKHAGHQPFWPNWESAKFQQQCSEYAQGTAGGTEPRGSYAAGLAD